ncbi:hypothetical protein ZWY2020_011573 [Hordeum vulgare]|nr:hypothetical protein ZWY2020_011573 [Hordeum vulgare]
MPVDVAKLMCEDCNSKCIRGCVFGQGHRPRQCVSIPVLMPTQVPAWSGNRDMPGVQGRRHRSDAPTVASSETASCNSMPFPTGAGAPSRCPVAGYATVASYATVAVKEAAVKLIVHACVAKVNVVFSCVC